VLVTGPGILILDEPTNQLDLKNRASGGHANHCRARRAHVIVISHDLPLVEDFDRVLLFHEGQLVADGPASESIRTYHEVAGC
jgi:biotin transport system ATP-binding protein